MDDIRFVEKSVIEKALTSICCELDAFLKKLKLGPLDSNSDGNENYLKKIKGYNEKEKLADFIIQNGIVKNIKKPHIVKTLLTSIAEQLIVVRNIYSHLPSANHINLHLVTALHILDLMERLCELFGLELEQKKTSYQFTVSLDMLYRSLPISEKYGDSQKIHWAPDKYKSCINSKELIETYKKSLQYPKQCFIFEEALFPLYKFAEAISEIELNSLIQIINEYYTDLEKILETCKTNLPQFPSNHQETNDGDGRPTESSEKKEPKSVYQKWGKELKNQNDNWYDVLFWESGKKIVYNNNIRYAKGDKEKIRQLICWINIFLECGKEFYRMLPAYAATKGKPLPPATKVNNTGNQQNDSLSKLIYERESNLPRRLLSCEGFRLGLYFKYYMKSNPALEFIKNIF